LRRLSRRKRLCKWDFTWFYYLCGICSVCVCVVYLIATRRLDRSKASPSSSLRRHSRQKRLCKWDFTISLRLIYNDFIYFNYLFVGCCFVFCLLALRSFMKKYVIVHQ
jgi:hypothetical protein